MGDVLAEGDSAESAAFRVRAMGQGPRETCGDESHGSWALEEKVRETIDAEEAAGQARKVARLVRGPPQGTRSPRRGHNLHARAQVGQ